MKTTDDLRGFLDGTLRRQEAAIQSKWGIFYKGERIGFTNREFVNYTSKRKALNAMIQHGEYKHYMSEYIPKQGYNYDPYIDAVLELLQTGELEIKQLT